MGLFFDFCQKDWFGRSVLESKNDQPQLGRSGMRWASCSSSVESRIRAEKNGSSVRFAKRTQFDVEKQGSRASNNLIWQWPTAWSRSQRSGINGCPFSATKLLSRYPMLQVEIYDAKAKTRTRVEQGKAVGAE
jgi:hypothetical protein